MVKHAVVAAGRVDDGAHPRAVKPSGAKLFFGRVEQARARPLRIASALTGGARGGRFGALLPRGRRGGGLAGQGSRSSFLHAARISSFELSRFDSAFTSRTRRIHARA